MCITLMNHKKQTKHVTITSKPDKYSTEGISLKFFNMIYIHGQVLCRSSRLFVECHVYS